MTELKKLGEGFEGDVFLIDEKGTKYIKKIMRIPENAVKQPDTKFSIWREIEFAQFAKNYPEYFMQLHSFKIQYDCNYNKKIPKYIKNNKNALKNFKQQQNTPYCAELIYSPVLDGRLGDLYRKINEEFEGKFDDDKLSFPNEYYAEGYSLLFQQLYILYILYDNNWNHRDAHPFNWLYKKTNNPIILGQYKLKCLHQVFLCDYGLIIHELHKYGPAEKGGYDFEKDRLNDIVLNIINNVQDPIAHNYHPNKLNLPREPFDIYSVLRKTEHSKNITFNKISNKELNYIIFNHLYKIKYPIEYYTLIGLDMKKYGKYILQTSSHEIAIQEYLLNHLTEPKKIFAALNKYLH